MVRRGDENGFIMPSRIHDNPDFEVVFLGGSTTECLSIPEKQRFPYLTGRLLENQHDMKVNAYNGGKSGSSSNHSVLSLFGKVIPMNADAVVLMHAINDLMFLMTAGSYWAEHYRRGMIQEKHYDPIRKWVTEREINHIFLPSPRTDYDQYRGKPADLDIGRITQSFRKTLELFIFICRQHNIKPVLMTQASRITATPDNFMQAKAKQLKSDFSVEYEDFQEAYSAMNQTIRNVSKQQDVLLIDLAKQIAPDESMMYDSVHFTVKGSQAVAKIVAETLGNMLLPG
ncbi:SGNH/GDSL hydrolase family protein [Salidesulfovibrio brasiliensis]|uniref:SGNH/GDSL hydrolase family protein n=1 Tax=Salidesulfovibrio brasiliensis TaxID=221711 RepID=UPI0006CF468C|nr:SGNH/GDSL hydrolase family protein [Salidesulfovibrio brasiliensis]